MSEPLHHVALVLTRSEILAIEAALADRVDTLDTDLQRADVPACAFPVIEEQAHRADKLRRLFSRIRNRKETRV